MKIHGFHGFLSEVILGPYYTWSQLFWQGLLLTEPSLIYKIQAVETFFGACQGVFIPGNAIWYFRSWLGGDFSFYSLCRAAEVCV